MDMPKEVMNFKDVVKYTGFSESYLYRLSSLGMLPSFRPFGKCLFFKKEDIDAALLKNKTATADQIDEKAATYISLSKGGNNKKVKKGEVKNG